MVVVRTRDLRCGNPDLFWASRRIDGNVSPPPKSQSSKNRCRSLCGGCLQPQKGVAPPCLTETPTTSNQPSSGNFGVKRGLGCWRGRKRFGMEGCPMKHRRSIQSSPGVLLWANDCVPLIQKAVVPLMPFCSEPPQNRDEVRDR